MTKISANTKICMVIGNPVKHSLSPQMHNAGYRALGLDGQFVYVACQVHKDSMEDFVKGVRTMGIRGVSCTVPHKTKIIPYLNEIDPIAEKIGAVNTVVNDGGFLRGFNTDYLGVINPLLEVTSLQGKKVALIGAGGAARGALYGLIEAGAEVWIFNRTLEKAEALAKLIGGEAFSPDYSWRLSKADIIINATTVGMESDETPVPKALLHEEQIVFDTVYNQHRTRLLRDAKAAGAKVIYGIEMLLHQGVAQFKHYTGLDAPVNAMRNALQKHIK